MRSGAGRILPEKTAGNISPAKKNKARHGIWLPAWSFFSFLLISHFISCIYTGCGILSRTRQGLYRYVSIHAPVLGAASMTCLCMLYNRISIHASIWRDGFHLTLPVVDAISIHAPVRGATKLRIHCPCLRPYFNPRTCMGCDRSDRCDRHAPAISIHAPVWGATIDDLPAPLLP